ncbi:MAG: hypothetical protein M2R45_04646 [Verrucomicrobia subdivision 3 bacterium]|nr:hypothetical protein [Limisphaerales bacterium]MCS1417138.1 hypothetical protein [Limisphaerales bacterium]
MGKSGERSPYFRTLPCVTGTPADAGRFCMSPETLVKEEQGDFFAIFPCLVERGTAVSLGSFPVMPLWRNGSVSRLDGKGKGQ